MTLKDQNFISKSFQLSMDWYPDVVAVFSHKTLAGSRGVNQVTSDLPLGSDVSREFARV